LRYWLTLFFIFVCSFIYSQTYWNRSHVITASAGVYNLYKLKVKSEFDSRGIVNYNISNSFPSLHLKYEYFIERKTSIGCEFSYARIHATFSKDKPILATGQDTNFHYEISTSNPAVAPFVSFHANNHKLSPFLTIGFQINFISDKFIKTNDPNVGKEDYATFDESPAKTFFGQLGLSYMISEKWGVSVYATYFPSLFGVSIWYRVRKE